jgi:hypothetical protein
LLLPPHARGLFVAIGLTFYWLAVLWPLRVWRQRRALAGWRGRATLAAAGLLVLAAGWATLVEPLLLEREHRTLAFAEVSTQPIRVAHVTDLQLVDLGPREHALVDAVNAFDPHLIVLTGDYICAHTGEDIAVAAARDVLSRLRARHGIFATTSDSDTFAQQRRIFAGLGVELLLNRSLVREVEGVRVRVGGVNHLQPRWDRTRGDASAAELFVVGCHTPDLAETASERMPETDLFLCGHTHGGQVQVPGIGPLITLSRVPRHVAAGGVFRTRNGMPFALSRGVGMEGNYAPRLRFGCRPHVFLLTLTGRDARQ